LINHPAAKTKTHRAEFVRGIRARFQPLRRRDKIFGHLLSIDFTKSLGAFLVVARITTD